MKYRVNYRSVGLLTGREPGDTVELDSHDAARLQSFGLVSPLSGPTEQPQAGPAETKKPATAPTEEEQRAQEAKLLEPYGGDGGWYTFPATEEGGDPVKVRGHDAALKHYRENVEGQHGTPGQPAERK